MLEEQTNAVARLFELKEQVQGLAKKPKHMKLIDHNDVILICEYIELLRKSGSEMVDVVVDLTAHLNNVKTIAKSGSKREKVIEEIDRALVRHNLNCGELT